MTIKEQLYDSIRRLKTANVEIRNLKERLSKYEEKIEITLTEKQVIDVLETFVVEKLISKQEVQYSALMYCGTNITEHDTLTFTAIIEDIT